MRVGYEREEPAVGHEREAPAVEPGARASEDRPGGESAGAKACGAVWTLSIGARRHLR